MWPGKHVAFTCLNSVLLCVSSRSQEKAYAKLHRTYEAIESGFVDQALVDLSGGIGSRIDMSKEPAKSQSRTGQLFHQLLQYRQAGFLLGAGSPAGSDSESNASPSGIVQGHAYSILDVQEVDGFQLIRLRNPWGRKEWTGDWSDNSDKWTRRLKAKLNWVAADDGTTRSCDNDAHATRRPLSARLLM
jgi:hypothetical protein